MTSEKLKHFSNGHDQIIMARCKVASDWIVGIWGKICKNALANHGNEFSSHLKMKALQFSYESGITKTLKNHRFGFDQLFMERLPHPSKQQVPNAIFWQNISHFPGKCNLWKERDWSAGLTQFKENVGEKHLFLYAKVFAEYFSFLNGNATLVHQIYCLTRGMRWWRASERERERKKYDMTEVFYYTSCVSHRYSNLKHFTFIILIGWIIAFANKYGYSVEVCVLYSRTVQNGSEIGWHRSQQPHTKRPTNFRIFWNSCFCSPTSAIQCIFMLVQYDRLSSKGNEWERARKGEDVSVEDTIKWIIEMSVLELWESGQRTEHRWQNSDSNNCKRKNLQFCCLAHEAKLNWKTV